MTERSEQIQILYEIVTSIDTELDLQDMLKKCLSIYVRKLNCSAGAVFKLNQYSQEENYYFKEIVSMPKRIHNNSAYKDAIKQIPQESNKQILNEIYKHLPISLHISENQHCHIMNLPGFGLIIFLKGGEPIKVDLLNSLLSLNKEIADACKSCLNIEALRESEEKYRTVFENTGTAMIIIEEDKTIFMTNTQLEKISGYSKEEMENKMKWTDFIFPEDLKMMEKHHSERRKAGSKVPAEYEFRLLDKKGNIKDIFLKIRMIPGTKKSVASLMDITERKQAEKELKDSEERLKILFDYAPDPYYISDLKGKFIDGNKAAEKLIGYKKEKLIGKNFLKLKLLSLADIPKAAKLLMKNLRRLPTGPDEFVLNRKDNTKVTVEISTYPVKIKGRALALGIARDITEHKKAEQNIKNAKDELQMIMDSVPALIIYKDIEGRIIRANKTLADRLEIPVKDIVGKAIEELFPKEQAENMRKDDKEVIISGKPKRDIIQPYTTPDGTRWTITDKMPYKDKEGKIIGVIAFAKDITVQRKSAQKLKQTYQKLKKTMDASIETMSKILEAKDPYTAGHQQRVSQLATSIAEELNLSQDKIEGIRIASLIHDIGKIGLPTEILSKPSKLTDIEINLIRSHSQIGYDILKSIEFPWPIAQIILQHHEKMNGSGYPRGLKDKEILLEARIICVADVVEAMSSHRPYRPALGIDKALEEISKNRGTLYDPEVVDVCLKLFKEKGFKF